MDIGRIIITFEERNPNFVLVALRLACKRFEIFRCPADCQIAAPITFIQWITSAGNL